MAKKHRTEKTEQCPYNEGVFCSPPKVCTKCGWNPKVDEQRRNQSK